MSAEQRVLRIIEQIYDAATDPAGMDRLASVVAREFGTESGLISLGEMSSNGMIRPPPIVGLPSATENFDSWARSAYAVHYHERNIWLGEAAKLGCPTIVLCHEIVDQATLLRSEWFDYCQKLDAFHCLGAYFQIADNLVGAFGAHRSRRAMQFDEEDRRMMAQLLPHLQRALQINIKLRTADHERGLTLDIFERLTIGIIVVAGNGQLLHANQIAERVLRDGQGLTVSQGRLRTSNPQQAPALERLISRAAQTSRGKAGNAGGVINIQQRAGQSLSVLVSPLRSKTMGFGPSLPAAVLVFSDSTNPPVVSDRMLAEIYQLTTAEARLLAALLAGRTVSEYAIIADVSVGTVRTHLKHVMEKTGHHRQSDLIRAVMANALLRVSS